MTERRREHGSWLLEAIVVLTAVGFAFAPLSPTTVERWFSTGVYVRLQRLLTPASNMLPIAWLDLLGVAAIVWLVWTWTRACRPAPLRMMRRLARAARATITLAAAVYLAFLMLWGLNYRRVPMASRLVVDARPASDADVAALGREVAARINALHATAHTAGWSEPVWRNESLRRAFAELQPQFADALPAVPGRLKRTLFGPVFRWTGVDGMVNPFGLEVLANPDLLPFERPFVVAHEWAHLAGYADESEANFVGWLTCLRADVSSQYSGWLYLYWQVTGELPSREREALRTLLASGPRDDLAAIVARLRRGDLPLLRRVTWAMYDQFLKANRVEAGIRSYGEVVTLILRARFEDGWRPVRRSASPSPSRAPS